MQFSTRFFAFRCELECDNVDVRDMTEAIFVEQVHDLIDIFVVLWSLLKPLGSPEHSFDGQVKLAYSVLLF